MLGNLSTSSRRNSSKDFKTQHALQMLSSMDKLRAWERICDFTIQVGKESFPVHRVALVASSEYFRDLLLQETEEAKVGILNLDKFNVEVVKLCIEFIYTGEAVIVLENVDQLLSASGFFKLKGLTELCLNHLQKNLTLHNCLSTRELCETHRCEEIEKKVKNYIQNNFEDIIATDKFCQLNKQGLVKCITTTDVDAEILWEAVIRWVKYQEWTRRQHFFELISINMVKLKSKFFLSTVWKEPLVQQHKQCRNLVVSILLSNLENLKESIDSNNCFLIRQICRSQPHSNSKDIQHAIDLFLLKNFEEIVHNENFGELTIEEILLLFRSTKTKYSQESLKYEAAVSWVWHDLTHRRKHFTELFKLIRLENLTSNFLQDVVRPSDLVQQSQECKDLITDAFYSLASSQTSPAAKKVREGKSNEGKSAGTKTTPKSTPKKSRKISDSSDSSQFSPPAKKVKKGKSPNEKTTPKSTPEKSRRISDSSDSSQFSPPAKKVKKGKSPNEKTTPKSSPKKSKKISDSSDSSQFSPPAKKVREGKSPKEKTTPKSVTKSRKISDSFDSHTSSQFSSPAKKVKSPKEKTTPKSVTKSRKISMNSTKFIAVMDRRHSSIRALDISETKWTKLVACRSSVSDFYTIVSVEKCLYLLSGVSLCRLTKNKEWKKLASLPKEPSTAAKTVAFQNRLYVIDKTQIFRYSVIVDQWDNNFPNLSINAQFCTAATDQNIYVIGGNLTSSFAHRYEPDIKRWSRIPPMETYRTNCAAASLGGRIYVLGGVDHTPTNSVSCYDPMENVWTEVQVMNCPRAKLSVCTDGNKIYAVGGKQSKNDSDLDSVEVYEKSRGKYRWKVMHSMMKYTLPIHACLVSF